MEQTKPEGQATDADELREEAKNEWRWEMNHEKILRTIRNIQSMGFKPSITSIAFEAGLSRTTVYKHLQEDTLLPVYKTYTQMHKFMLNDVLMEITEKACRGDVKAARLYFEIMGIIKRVNTVIDTDRLQGNDTIAVNGHKLTDEMVKKLSPENLLQLEEFIKTAEEKSTPKN